MNLLFKVLKGVFGFILGIFKFLISPILIGLVVLAGFVFLGFYFFSGFTGGAVYDPCVEVNLSENIDAWDKLVSKEELENSVNYGGYNYSSVDFFGYDVLLGLKCKVGSEEGQNLNYCYLDKRIEIVKVDLNGNILDDKKIGLIFDMENNLISSYC